jgi:uncharacterized protein DUF4136
MKTLSRLVLVSLIISGLSACSSYNYYTAGLNKTNMSQYRSFAWVSPQGNNNKSNNIADSKIKDAAVASLSMKGLRQSNNPDLFVTYTATVGRGTKSVYYPVYSGYGGFYPGWGFGFGWGWGYRPWYGGWYGYGGLPYYSGEAVDKEHYKEGTIIIDLIDSHTKRVVWRGYGVGEVHRNPQKNVDDIPKVVGGIIGQLQLTPGSKS